MSEPVKKHLGDIVLLLTFAALAALALSSLHGRPASAASTQETAVRIDAGTYIETRVVIVTTHTATEITNGASAKRPDETCFNNSAFTVWIGTQAAGTTLSQFGFPVLSSATFSVGALTTQVYGLFDSAAGGNKEIRCVDGLLR